MRNESMTTASWPRELQDYGGQALRWMLVLVFLWFGFLKFTDYEAKGIAPLIMNSPLLAWAFQALGQQGISMVIGAIELAIGVLIALRPVSARWSGIGSVGAVVTFLITLSFLFSTPGVWQEGHRFPFLSGMVGQFLIKDVVLLAASLWTAGEAFSAAHMAMDRAPTTAVHSRSSIAGSL